MEIQLKRSGLVSKILTWGEDIMERERYLSSPQNICPMIWKFAFKIIWIVIQGISTLIGIVFLLSVAYKYSTHLTNLTFWDGLLSVLTVLGSLVLMVIIPVIFSLIVEEITAHFSGRSKPSQNEVLKLAVSFQEARKNKFCSVVSFM